MPLASTSRTSSHPFLRTLSRWLLGTVGLAWIAIAASLCGCGTTNGWVMNESGKGYYRRGDYAQAAREFERAMMDRPDRADYAYNYAAAVDQMGNHGVAEKVYRHALSLDPGHQPSYHGLAALMVEEGRGKEANDLIGTWAATQPYSAEAATEMGWLKAEEGDLDGADRELRKALRQNPNNTRAKKQLARVYNRTGRREEAAAEYASSLFVDPLQPDVKAEMAAMDYGPYGSPALQIAGSMQPYNQSPQFTLPNGQPQLATMGMPQTPMMSSQPAYPQATYPQTGYPQMTAPGMGAPDMMASSYPTAPAGGAYSAATEWQPMGVTPNQSMVGYPDAVTPPYPPQMQQQHMAARPQGQFFQPQTYQPGYPGAMPAPQMTTSTIPMNTAPAQASSFPAGQPIMLPAQASPNGQMMMTGYSDAPAWNGAGPGGQVIHPEQTSSAPVVPAF